MICMHMWWTPTRMPDSHWILAQATVFNAWSTSEHAWTWGWCFAQYLGVPAALRRRRRNQPAFDQELQGTKRLGASVGDAAAACPPDKCITAVLIGSKDSSQLSTAVRGRCVSVRASA